MGRDRVAGARASQGVRTRAGRPLMAADPTPAPSQPAAVPNRPGGAGKRGPKWLRATKRRATRMLSRPLVGPEPIDRLWPDAHRYPFEHRSLPLPTPDVVDMDLLPTHLEFRHAMTTFPDPEVIVLPGGVYAPAWNVVLHPRSRKIVAENLSSRNNSLGPVRTLRDARVDITVDGTCAILRTNSRGFAHTIVEDIPRAALLACPQLADREIRLLVPEPIHEPEALLLARLLPDNVTVEAIPRGLYRIEELLFPAQVASSVALPTWYLEHLHEVLADHIVEGSRRIYLSRGVDVARRRLTNEAEVLEGLVARGFEVVDPGALAFTEQIELFSSSKVIVGVHGAAFANLMFTTEPTVVELFSSPMVQPAMYLLGCGRGHRYHHLHGAGAGNNDDFAIPPHELFALVDSID